VTASPLLDLVRLRKTLPGGRVLFSDLSLRVAPGELVAIMGESGAGKSSLLNLAAGLDTPDAGAVMLGATDLGALAEDARALLRRRHIGFVFQAFHILPHLTLGQNVALPLALLRHRADDALGRAADLLARVGLAGRAGDYPARLSGGELQRVAIARAIIHAPGLILADEPTGNLDPDTAGRVLALLVEQVRQVGAGAVLVTHSDVAAACADRVLRLTAQGLVAA
jgi:putative ABC transport system ATP-binding protein